MSLSTHIEKELARLAVQGDGQLNVSVPNGRLLADCATVDVLACAFECLSYETTEWANASIEYLQRRAAELSARLSYLLESVSPIEIDNEACVVQMRSNPPDQDGGSSKYYELVVSRDGIRLSRYVKMAGQPRHVVPAAVTREVFVRLANDFVATDG